MSGILRACHFVIFFRNGILADTLLLSVFDITVDQCSECFVRDHSAGDTYLVHFRSLSYYEKTFDVFFKKAFLYGLIFF